MARPASSALAALRHRLAATGLALATALGSLGAPARAQPAAPCTPAAAPTADEWRAAAQQARDRGFLWRLSRDGRTSYLYGTLHVARLPWVFPGPRVRQALEASNVVALELDPLDPDIAQRLVSGMRADADERLPPALAARLRAQVIAACLPPDALSPLAAAVQLMVLTSLVGRPDGFDPAFAIDTALAGHARGLHKPVHSLESPEMQLALLRGDPATLPVQLDRGLAQLEGGQARPLLRRMAEVWDQGRRDELARYAQWCQCADTEADRADLKRLLDDRNPPLADRIEALHAGGLRVFAAVGALHMVGPAGLPALLTQRGFVVEAIDLAR